MITPENHHFSLYFGDKQSSLSRDILMGPLDDQGMEKIPFFGTLKDRMSLNDLLLLKQIHSSVGVAVSQDVIPALKMHKPEGDFLITRDIGVGLGVYTADCLPIVLYDSKNHALGVCHAGWMGTVGNVLVHMLNGMKIQYGTDPLHVQALFGPSARTCCYEVQEDFSKHLEHYAFKEQVLTKRGEKWYFDIPLCNKLQLMEYGALPENCDMSYNACTMCEGNYCSNRLNREDTSRQLNVAVLHQRDV